MTRVNVVRYVLINSRASRSTRGYINNFDFDRDYVRLSYEKRGAEKQTRRRKEGKQAGTIEPRLRDTHISLEGQGQRYLWYLIGMSC